MVGYQRTHLGVRANWVSNPNITINIIRALSMSMDLLFVQVGTTPRTQHHLVVVPNRVGLGIDN